MKYSNSWRIDYRENADSQPIVPGVESIVSYWSLVPLLIVAVAWIGVWYFRKIENENLVLKGKTL